MINKKRFGKRIAFLRRKRSLSQAELAEIMGVSAQAVSKWETGAAIPDIEILLELSKLYGASVNELMEDNSLTERLTNVPFIAKDGIAVFLPERKLDPEWDEWEREMRKERWIERNWRDACGQNGGWADSEYGANMIGDRLRPSDLRVGGQIAEHGGVILEIGTGPGGGYMPYVLQADPAAQIIISDMSLTVVEEWKRFLEQETDTPNVCFAVMDFCAIPFESGTVDVVSDHGAVINCVGDRGAALREIYRVLKPGGIFVSSNGFVTKESLAQLPENARSVIIEQYPDVCDSLYEETVMAGFQKIDCLIEGGWSTEEDESGIASIAKKHGVTIQFTQYVRFCEK